MQSLFSYLDGDDLEAPQPQEFDEDERPAARFAPRKPRAEPPTASLLVNDTVFHVVRLIDERATFGREGGSGRPQLGCDGKDAFLLTVGHYGFLSDLESESDAVRSLHFSSRGSGNKPTCSALNSKQEMVVGFSTGLVFYMNGTDRKQLNPESIASAAAVVSLVFNEQGLIWTLFADGVVLLLDPKLPFQEESDWSRLTVSNFCAIDGTNPRIARVCSQGRATGMDCSGHRLAVTSQGGVCNLYQWESESLSRIGSFKTYFGAALCVKFNSDGSLVAVGGEDDLVTVYSMDLGTTVYRLQGLCSFATGLSFGTDGLLVACCDSKLCFFKLEDPLPSEASEEERDVAMISPIGFVDTARFVANVLWFNGYLIVAESRGTALVYKEGRL